MKIEPWMILGVAVVAILLILMTRKFQEHLTGQTIFTPQDLQDIATGNQNSQVAVKYGQWVATNWPILLGNVQAVDILADYISFYGSTYTSNTSIPAPIGTTDDFLTQYAAALNKQPQYNNTVTVQLLKDDMNIPAGGKDLFLSNVVYDWFYGPKSPTPYISPMSGGSAKPTPMSGGAVPSSTPAPAPAPSSTPSSTTSAGPPAASSSPNQPLTFYVPQPCKKEYKSIPGGSVELRCFD
jgi:hypothetical protein